MTKVCAKCLCIKELIEFNKDKTHKDGIKSQCKACVNKYKKEYYKNNREKILKKGKEYSSKNKEKRKEYDKNNSEKIRIRRRNYIRQRRQNESAFKIKEVIQTSIRMSINKRGFIKKSRAYEILGCTYEQALKHLEQTFLINYSRPPNENDIIEIDHIIPISSAKTEEDIIRLNHISNLQRLLKKR
jgi:hypothetical protein